MKLAELESAKPKFQVAWEFRNQPRHDKRKPQAC